MYSPTSSDQFYKCFFSSGKTFVLIFNCAFISWLNHYYVHWRPYHNPFPTVVLLQTLSKVIFRITHLPQVDQERNSDRIEEKKTTIYLLMKTTSWFVWTHLHVFERKDQAFGKLSSQSILSMHGRQSLLQLMPFITTSIGQIIAGLCNTYVVANRLWSKLKLKSCVLRLNVVLDIDLPVALVVGMTSWSHRCRGVAPLLVPLSDPLDRSRDIRIRNVLWLEVH